MRGWDSTSQRAVIQRFHRCSANSPRNSFWSLPKALLWAGSFSSGPRPVLVVSPTGASCASWGSWSCPLSRKSVCWDHWRSLLTSRAIRCSRVSSVLAPLHIKFSTCRCQPPGLCTRRNSRLLKGLVSSKGACDLPRLHKLPHLLKFLRQTEVSLQTHYKSQWVFEWPRCCSFSPSAMSILQLFFLVSPVSTVSWQGLHVIHDKRFRMTWKSSGNGWSGDY